MMRAAHVVVIVLGIGALSRGARADAMAAARAAVAPCTELGEVTAVRPVPGRAEVVQVWPRSGPSALVLVGRTGASGSGCAVLPLERPARPLRGNFLPGTNQALAVTERACSDGACAGAIVVSQAKDPTAVLDVLPWPDDCSGGIELSRLRAVPGVDSLAVVCKQATFSAHRLTGAIVHGVGGPLRSIFTWSPGADSYASAGELASGICHERRVGRIEVVRKGRAPLLRIVQAPPPGDEGPWEPTPLDKRGRCAAYPALDQRWAWDTSTHRLSPVGAPARIRRDVCDCPRRRRR